MDDVKIQQEQKSSSKTLGSVPLVFSNYTKFSHLLGSTAIVLL